MRKSRIKLAGLSPFIIGPDLNVPHPVALGIKFPMSISWGGGESTTFNSQRPCETKVKLPYHLVSTCPNANAEAIVAFGILAHTLYPTTPQNPIISQCTVTLTNSNKFFGGRIRRKCMLSVLTHWHKVDSAFSSTQGL